MRKSGFSTRQIAVAGLLGALTVAMGLLPVGGFIPVPTAAGNATTMHIPTILAGILEGPVVGGLVGLVFGVFSFWRAQTQANPVAKSLFSDPLIAFVPRILIGVIAHYTFLVATGELSRKVASGLLGIAAGYTVYATLTHLAPNLAGPSVYIAVGVIGGLLVWYGAFRTLKMRNSAPALAALLATLENTVGVLGLAVLRGFLTAPVAIGIAVLHGLPEMLAATVLTVLVYRGLLRTRLVKNALDM